MGEPPAGLARNETVEHYCEPTRPTRDAAELKRCGVQNASHRSRVIVVTGNAVDRDFERCKDFTKSLIAIRIILNEVSGREDGVTRPMTRARVLDRGEERSVGSNATQLAIGITIEVRIRELYEADATHRLGHSPACERALRSVERVTFQRRIITEGSPHQG